MDIIVIIIFVLCATFIFPAFFGLFEFKTTKLKAIIEVEDSKITIRKSAIERLFSLKGNKVCTASIVRIQFATNLIGGTCVTLFNKSDGAMDFWIPEHLENAVKDKLKTACSHANFVEV
ncbi:hypothetical protein CGI93_22405 [Vibrio parahaemolyticus]|uniref:hypothetical protein n=1 Tax=Vibrio parahaemolyticus TaxID=670 RepID=UPI00111F4D03|nr:hypothetical protein [Vibrio parahaemolyticus]TOG81126.1 hypothetical protein CGI93_22405 [Vibrio parahaemolyticus]HCK0617608.1 hypothetical protein [Vibrio parahaemolyticus]